MSLTKKQLITLDRAIDTRYEELSSEAQTHTRQLHDDEVYTMTSGVVGDPVDYATADLIFAGDNAAVERDVKELRELEAARLRLAAGDYGICTDCSEEIDFERLRACPGAERCVFCQDVFERTSKRLYAQPEMT